MVRSLGVRDGRGMHFVMKRGNALASGLTKIIDHPSNTALSGVSLPAMAPGGKCMFGK